MLSLLDVMGVARMYQPDPELIKDYAERMGTVDPLQYMKERVGEAKEALDIAQRLEDRLKADAMDEYQLLLKHMRATVLFGEHWLNLLTAKVIFEVVDVGYHTFSGLDRGRYAQQAIQYFEDALAWLRKLDELLPLREPSGRSFWHIAKREEEFAQLKERLNKCITV